MSGLPIDHLSASSLNKFMRCPRQWQNHYLRDDAVPEPASEALVIGSAVHLALSRLMMEENPGSYFQEAIASYNGDIRWDKLTPDTAKDVADKQIYHYYETIGKHLRVVGVEKEFNLGVNGVDIPVVGYVDLETTEGIIDYKTTRYFSRKGIQLNPEWKFQQAVYQCVIQKPGEIHVLTRSKTDPVVVPSSKNDPLYVGLVDRYKTADVIRHEYHRMVDYWNRYGVEYDWPGNVNHVWASRYCALKEEGKCCTL